MMRTLIINTYAGSLLLGASAVQGANIRGSFEDAGFGAKITKANAARWTEVAWGDDFEGFFVDTIQDWPALDLYDTIVLAHPPCAAFSRQNRSSSKRGTTSDAFACTKKVLEYAFARNAAAVAIESVTGALGGAWDIHDEFAKLGGYHVYRVLQNSVLFGVPQSRERFWALFVKKGAADPTLRLTLSPSIRTVAQALEGVDLTEPLPDNPVKDIAKILGRVTTGPCRCGETHGLDPEVVRELGLSSPLTWRTMKWDGLLRPLFPGVKKTGEVARHLVPFASRQPWLLAPGGHAPVLLSDSTWVYRGQVLGANGYKALMGFPADYVFPKAALGTYGVRAYLSKGVVPSVATWVLDSLRKHLGQVASTPFTRPGGYDKVCEPNKVVNFCPSRVTILKAYEELWTTGSLASLPTLRNTNEE